MHCDPTIHLANILMIDKDAEHHSMVRKVLQKEGFERLARVLDPADAAKVAQKEQFDLVLLNPNEQRLNQFELMSALRVRPISDGTLPVIVFLDKKNGGFDRKGLLEMGASDFLPVSADPDELALRVRNCLQVRWLNRRINGIADEIEARVQERTRGLYEDQLEMLERLARASEYRDDDTGDHTRRVGTMSAKIAMEMGLPEEEVDLIRLAAPLHDIGKIGIRDAILMKPGKLTESEFVVMRTHAIIGSKILEGKSPLLRMAEVIARTHHERWDGTGYPSRLAGENIPLPGRIVAVADVYDALTSPRAYKAAWPQAKAVEEINAQAGRHFDPKVVDAFLRVLASESALKKAA